MQTSARVYTDIGPDQYPFYNNEVITKEQVKPKQEIWANANTFSNYRLSRNSAPSPKTVIPLDQNGRFPYSTMPQVPTAVTNRAETIMYRLYVESDGALSYDVSGAASLAVTNRAGTTYYKIYIEDDGSISYDLLAAAPLNWYVFNRAEDTMYRLYVEDDGALSYDSV